MDTKMTKINYENEKIKRVFCEYLKGVRGFSEESVNSFAEATNLWEEFTNHEDFRKFNKSQAIEFIKWIKTKKTKTKTGCLSTSTQYNYLRRIKKFFVWLIEQQGYKNKMIKNDIGFLRLSNAEARIATSGTTRRMPTYEEVRKIIQAIIVTNEVDMRDRAMISFALITGMRISAIASLRIKSFDPQSEEIRQNPGDGVKTKNSKKIISTFFNIGWSGPKEYFLEWFKHLETKGFKQDDPIFPATNNTLTEKNGHLAREFVSKNLWHQSSGARRIFVRRCAEANVPYFNPHSFRHLIVHIMSEIRLTEKEKKAISLNMGHDNTGTTFGSYGYGSMSTQEVLSIVKKIGTTSDTNKDATLSSEEAETIKNLLEKFQRV